ncbi:cuticular protein hypothetical 16 [Aphomia sociella]
MNSLVVLLSVVALASAKPSELLNAGIVSYAAPAVATYPAAISQQSRIDIKSSPAVVATAAVAPIARTIIAEPAFAAAPIAYSAPAAVSSQSRIDIKSSPAVVSTVAAAAPIAYAAPLATAAIAPTFVKSAAIATPFVASGYLKTAAIASPALVGPSVPLDTPEVIAARAAHFEAKALAGAHLIHKRSAPFIGAPVISTYGAPVVSTLAAAPVISAYSAPVAFSTPLITKTYSVHPW